MILSIFGEGIAVRVIIWQHTFIDRRVTGIVRKQSESGKTLHERNADFRDSSIRWTLGEIREHRRSQHELTVAWLAPEHLVKKRDWNRKRVQRGGKRLSRNILQRKSSYFQQRWLSRPKGKQQDVEHVEDERNLSTGPLLRHCRQRTPNSIYDVFNSIHKDKFFRL